LAYDQNHIVKEIVSKISPLLRKGVPVVIGIDGRCASGKTSTAYTLASLYTDAVIIHMDDFFLPLSLRTDERYAEVGGNIHYERFLEEVVDNLKAKRETTFSYQAFNCNKMDYDENPKVVEVKQNSLIIIEGVYSLRPEFRGLYDVMVFMDIDSDEQRHRIKKRNGEDAYEVFVKKWIPLEEHYFIVGGFEDDLKSVIKLKSTRRRAYPPVGLHALRAPYNK